MEIKSEWVYEKGKWDKEQNKFVDVTLSKTYVKMLKTRVFINDNGKEILQFMGGPTGWESYYLDDLKKHDLKNEGKFCICAGTMNSWAKCSVKSRDIHNAIKWRKK